MHLPEAAIITAQSVELAGCERIGVSVWAKASAMEFLTIVYV
jgi:hypothetical protein